MQLFKGVREVKKIKCSGRVKKNYPQLVYTRHSIAPYFHIWMDRRRKVAFSIPCSSKKISFETNICNFFATHQLGS